MPKANLRLIYNPTAPESAESENTPKLQFTYTYPDRGGEQYTWSIEPYRNSVTSRDNATERAGSRGP